MKALSIKQPWAWAIVMGHKTVENRDWDTSYRGEFFVHAPLSFDNDGYDFIRGWFPEIPIPSRQSFENHIGGIVGKVTLINSVPIRDRHLLTEKDRLWFFGQYGFILDGAEPLPLQPCKGALGFFTPDFNSKYKDRK